MVIAENSDSELTDEAGEDVEDENNNGGDGDTNADADAEGCYVERDPVTGKVTGVRISNTFIDNCLIQPYSMVMVQAGKGQDKFLGYVRSLIEYPRDVELKICWFYRASDLGPSKTADMLICQARLVGPSQGGDGKRPPSSGGDKGRFKEIYFSNHMDKISVQSIMHPIKVWLLGTMSLDPVTLPPEALSDVSGDRVALLPGFICRQMYNTHSKELYPLSEVSSPKRREELGEALVEDVAALMRSSEAERLVYMRNWLQRCGERALKGVHHGRSEGDVEAAASDMDKT